MADIKLDPANVPPELHPLIPYAVTWGIRDHTVRRALLRQAPLTEIEEICEVLFGAWDEVIDFTVHHRPDDKLVSLEVEVFHSFSSALSDMYNILSDHNPKRVLEIIGFPETCPPMPFDHSKMPPELRYLISHAEKWVIADEGCEGQSFRHRTMPKLRNYSQQSTSLGNLKSEKYSLRCSVLKYRSRKPTSLHSCWK